MKFNVHRATKSIHRTGGTHAAPRPSAPDGQETAEKGGVAAGAVIDLRKHEEHREGERDAR